MLIRHHVFEITGVAQRGDHEHEKRHRASGRARKNVHAEHGGEPAVLRAEQPIVRGKRHAERKKRQAHERDFAQPNRKARTAVFILTH